MKVLRVYHSYYGCETGCCGHRIDFETADGEREEFTFGHPDENATREELIAWAKKEFERELGTAHCADLDWSQVDLSEVKDWRC